MELINEYHAIRSLQIKVSELDTLIKQTQEPEVKQALSTMGAHYTVQLKEKNASLLLNLSTMISVNPISK
jgi:hypothetical protein